MAVRILETKLFAAYPWCASGFTDRHGGTSAGAFSSLNLGLHVGDASEAVLQNRARVADSLGFVPEAMVCAEQVHRGEVAIVDGAARGRGATEIGDSVAGVDALITGSPGVLLTLFFADCIPVIFADTKNRIVAVAHAGWRGVVSGVIENTVDSMIAGFGTHGENIVVAIGPGIGACCFEVGEDVAEQFAPEPVVRARPGERAHVDLKADITTRLMRLGIHRDSVDDLGECTACDRERYFSYRRDSGKTGRMAAVIGIR